MVKTAGFLFIICALLAGCVTQQEAAERVWADSMACAAGQKTQLMKVKCAVDAENRYLVPRYPDLVYFVHTQAEALARRVDRGELTPTQAKRRLRLVQAKVAKEMQWRETSVIWHTPKL